jgi:hypothetical protein
MKTALTAIGVDSTDSARKPSTDDDVQRRIVALRARKPVKKAVPDVFQFDPTEPLRLKKPRKPEPDK